MNSIQTCEKRFHGWSTLSMAGMVMFVSMGVAYTFQLFLPILCKEFGWSRAMVGGAASVSMIFMGLAAPLSGIITNRHGAKAAIIGGNILAVLGLLLLYFQNQPWQLYVGYGVLFGAGAGGIGTYVPTNTLANNWFIRKRSLALGIVTSSPSLGSFMLLPIATVLVNAFGWRACYLALAGIVVVFSIVLPGIIIKNKPEDVGEFPDGLLSIGIENEDPEAKAEQELHTTPIDFTLVEAMKTRALWLLITANVFILFINGMIMTHQIAYLESIGITGMVAATAAGLMNGVTIVGALGIGFLGIRINMWPLTTVCIVFVIIGMSLLMIADNVPMVFAFNIFLGLGYGAFMTGCMGLLTSYFGRSHFPKILGFTMLFGTLLGGSGSFIAGALFDATGSYQIPFQVGTLIAVMSLILVFLASPPKHPPLIKVSDALRTNK